MTLIRFPEAGLFNLLQCFYAVVCNMYGAAELSELFAKYFLVDEVVWKIALSAHERRRVGLPYLQQAVSPVRPLSFVNSRYDQESKKPSLPFS